MHYCSASCQRQSWLSEHKHECCADLIFQRSHRALDMCLKIATQVIRDGTLFEHMERFSIRARLLLFVALEDDWLGIIPLRRQIVSCLPISEEEKDMIRESLQDAFKLRILVYVRHGDDYRIMSTVVDCAAPGRFSQAAA